MYHKSLPQSMFDKEISAVKNYFGKHHDGHSIKYNEGIRGHFEQYHDSPLELFWIGVLRVLGNWNRVDFEGYENLPKEGAAIIVNAHKSYIDFLALKAKDPYFSPTAVPIRDDFFENPALSKILNFVDAYPVTRNPDEPDVEAAFRIEDFISQGRTVCIAPEGTRNLGHLYPMDRDVVAMIINYARGTKDRKSVPIIPLDVRNTDKVMGRGRFMIWPWKITVKVGKVIDFNECFPMLDEYEQRKKQLTRMRFYLNKELRTNQSEKKAQELEQVEEQIRELGEFYESILLKAAHIMRFSMASIMPERNQPLPDDPISGIGDMWRKKDYMMEVEDKKRKKRWESKFKPHKKASTLARVKNIFRYSDNESRPT